MEYVPKCSLCRRCRTSICLLLVTPKFICNALSLNHHQISRHGSLRYVFDRHMVVDRRYFFSRHERNGLITNKFYEKDCPIGWANTHLKQTKDGLAYSDEFEFDMENAVSDEMENDGDNSGNQQDEDSETMEAYNNLYINLSSSLEKANESNNKQRKSLMSELIKAQDAESMMHRANLITSNLYRLPPGTTSCNVEDWEKDGELVELQFDTDKFSSPSEEAEALFDKARRMKRGSTVVQDLLETNHRAEQILTTASKRLHDIHFSVHEHSAEGDKADVVMAACEDILELQRELLKSQKATKFKLLSVQGSNSSGKKPTTNSPKRSQNKKPSPRTFISPYSGLQILVGRNRRDNEYLSLQVARQSDLWLHARGCPGAHVLLKHRRGDANEPTPECLQLAANLAAFYSEARTERKAVITVAEPKHLSKPRGAPLGAVKIRQELKSIVGNPQDVPDECKEKRDENGGVWGTATSNEGGMRSLGGKAKNRKKTEEARKQSAAKRRAEKKKDKRKGRGSSDSDDGPRIVNGVVEGDWF